MCGQGGRGLQLHSRLRVDFERILGLIEPQGHLGELKVGDDHRLRLDGGGELLLCLAEEAKHVVALAESLLRPWRSRRPRVGSS